MVSGWNNIYALFQAYVAAAPYPFANIVGQEIFQAKLIPSDTDYKMLQNYGNLPGLDLAYIKNGFVYHTKYDDIDHVSLPSIQRAGDNLLSLVSHLANMEWPAERDFRETVVYFDYLGLFMVTLSNTWWHLLNCLIVSLAFYQTKVWIDVNNNSGNF